MKSPKPNIHKFPNICCRQMQNNWPEMRPRGSVGAHIKTGWRHMAQDRFQTPPDPQKGYERTTHLQKSFFVVSLES